MPHPIKLLWQDRSSRGEGIELIRIACKRGALLYEHTHDYPEVFWIEEGTCLHRINGGEDILSAGAIVFIRPFDTHQLLAAGVGGFTLCNFTLNPILTQLFTKRHPGDWDACWYPKGQPPRTSQATPAQMGRLKTLYSEVAEGNRDSLELEHFLTRLIRLFRPRMATGQEGIIPDWLIRALDSLNDSEVLRDGVPGFIKAAGHSHEHVTRECRRHLGLGPHALISNARMELAGRLLQQTQLTVEAIAEHCGYASTARFYVNFQRIHNQSPKRYRTVKQ
ncbi:MAG: AraC family transcriptional regulator [Verrucomicrobiota bacterium]|nr:AraC family transcriptional regulator [Verrucomicrobiota bacterium]